MSTVELILNTVQQLPEERQREVLDFAEFLSRRTPSRKSRAMNLRALDLSAWPEDCTFRREDLYGDDGR